MSLLVYAYIVARCPTHIDTTTQVVQRLSNHFRDWNFTGTFATWFLMSATHFYLLSTLMSANPFMGPAECTPEPAVTGCMRLYNVGVVT